jgi:hypothetical protein
VAITNSCPEDLTMPNLEWSDADPAMDADWPDGWGPDVVIPAGGTGTYDANVRCSSSSFCTNGVFTVPATLGSALITISW